MSNFSQACVYIELKSHLYSLGIMCGKFHLDDLKTVTVV